MSVKTEDKVYFDADCLSSFLRTDNEHLLVLLFGKQIVIPSVVVAELKGFQRRNRFPLYDRIIEMKNKGLVSFEDVKIGTNAYKIYDKLSHDNEIQNAIGKGESSVIALAVNNSKNTASNNLTDISYWIDFYQLNNITTCDILLEIYQKNILSKDEVCDVFLKIIKVQKLQFETFDEFLIKNKKHSKK